MRLIRIVAVPFDGGGGEKSEGCAIAPQYISRYLGNNDWRTAENGLSPIFMWDAIFADMPKNFDSFLPYAEEQLARYNFDIILGGDNSISIAGYRAVVKKFGGPVMLVHADAHPDCRDPNMLSSSDPHASWVRQLIEEGSLDPQNYFLFGSRANDRRGDADGSEYDYLRRLKIFNHVFSMSALENSQIPMHNPLDFASLFNFLFIADTELAKKIKGIYCAFDIDVIDPSLAPGTGCQASGGWNYRQARAFLRGLHEVAFRLGLAVKGDLTEVNPRFDEGGRTVRCAGDLLREWSSFFDEFGKI
ncbi:MAG: arginase family protein [bacterium]|nr:arginase family protein [bacterium]